MYAIQTYSALKNGNTAICDIYECEGHYAKQINYPQDNKFCITSPIYGDNKSETDGGREKNDGCQRLEEGGKKMVNSYKVAVRKEE
jgi:hypothetical protein